MKGKNYCKLHTEEMKQYPPFTPQSILTTTSDVTAMAAKLNEMADFTKEGFLFNQVQKVVEKAYDIGKLVEAHQLFGGYINTTFGIYTEKDGAVDTWLIRKYKRGKELDSLMFEHKLLIHAYDNGFSYGCRPIAAKNGATYHIEKEVYPGGEEDAVFAVFNYLDGVSTYDWLGNWAEPGMPEHTFLSAARSMAEFHSAMKGFNPGELHGDNIMDNDDITVNDLIAKFPETLKRFRKNYAEAGFENVFTDFFDNNYDYYQKMCEASVIPAEDYQKMHYCACQCDFHPGNFKYDEAGNVTASFDYDMAKMDTRLFEIGLGMHYCFASWKCSTNGVIQLENVEKFIGRYNEEIKNIGAIEPLNETEKKYLYEVMVQGTLYDMAWCTSACVYNPSLDPYEYLYYMQHFLFSLQWLEAHEAEIRAIADKI